MTPKQLNQKLTSFSIEDAGILKKTESKSGATEVHYLFESITNNKIYALEDNKGMLVFSIIMGVLAPIMFAYNGMDSPALVYLVIGMVLFALYYKSRVRKLYLSTSEGPAFFLLADIPNKEEVTSFVDAIYSSRNDYLLSKYSNLTKHVDYASQINNLNWLLNTRVLSKADYDVKVQELNALFSSPLGTTPIGFSKSN